MKPTPGIQVLMRERPTGGVARGRWSAIGSGGVHPLPPGRSRRAQILAYIPGGTALSACVDYRKVVQESDERNNCRTLLPLVTIGGSGVVANILATPSPVFFGDVVVGGNAFATVTFPNAGGQRSREIGPVSVTDDALRDFVITNDQCSRRSLGPEETC